jgi:hypothetical protein
MKNKYYAAALRRPAKADALININGLGVNTRAAERKPQPAHFRNTLEAAVKLTTGEWRDVNGGGEIEDVAPMPLLQADFGLIPNREQWTNYNRGGAKDCGMSKREWLRRRAFHVKQRRADTVAGMVARREAAGVLPFVVGSPHDIGVNWSA